MTRSLRIIVTGAALLSVSATAQSTAQTSTAPTRESLRELQREAARATIESQIKPEDRAAYQKLQTDFEALRGRELALREKMLRAYIEEVRGGKAPEIARANANAVVAQEAAALQQQRAQLNNDARTLAQKYPNLTRSLRFGKDIPALRPGERLGRQPNVAYGPALRFDKGRGQHHHRRY